MSCEDAITAIDYRGDKIAVGIGVCHPVLFYFAESGRSQKVLDGVEHGFDRLLLARSKGRAGIALDTTGAEARIKIAHEESFDKIQGDKGVFYLKHNFLFFYDLSRAGPATHDCHTAAIMASGKALFSLRECLSVFEDTEAYQAVASGSGRTVIDRHAVFVIGLVFVSFDRSGRGLRVPWIAYHILIVVCSLL